MSNLVTEIVFYNKSCDQTRKEVSILHTVWTPVYTYRPSVVVGIPVTSSVLPVKSSVLPVKSAVLPVKSSVLPVKSSVLPVKSSVLSGTSTGKVVPPENEK